MKKTVAGIDIPDSAMARAATEQIRGIESELMFHHALRSFLFGALTGYRRKLRFDPELLYVSALFHNVGLHVSHPHAPYRFEVDGANAAREFLRQHAAAQSSIAEVWEAIALHTTPGIPEHMTPLVALVCAGVQMDVRGAGYSEFTVQQREEIVRAYPRESDFKENYRSLRAWYGASRRDDFRHRECRRFGSMGSQLSPLEFLRAGAWFGLVTLTRSRLSKGSSIWITQYHWGSVSRSESPTGYSRCSRRRRL